jgi:hypothetical protein
MNQGYTERDRELAAGLVDTWHISKSIPLSIILFLLVQTIGIVLWAGRLDYRVSSLESAQPLQDTRLSKLEDIYAKVAVIDERQSNVAKRLDIQTKTMQDILELIRAWRQDRQGKP